MKLENFLLSKNKFEAIINLLEQPGKVDWEKLRDLINAPCGHCRESNEQVYPCAQCPLYKPRFCNSPINRQDGYYFDLGLMAYGDTERNKSTALTIAKRIYAAILKDDPRETDHADK